MVLDEGTSKVEAIFKMLETTIFLETSSSDLGLELCILCMCMFQWQRMCPRAEKKSLVECDSVQRLAGRRHTSQGNSILPIAQGKKKFSSLSLYLDDVSHKGNSRFLGYPLLAYQGPEMTLCIPVFVIYCNQTT